MQTASSKKIISIIIPCFNQGQYLEEAIDSVLASDWPDFEIIVVDDGSTEPTTIAVLDKLSKPKTRLIRQENRGLAGARQAGTLASSGEYFLPLDADDRIDPTYLRKAAALLETDPRLGYVYPHIIVFGTNNYRWQKPEYNFYKLLRDNYIASCTLVRRRAWDEIGGYNLTFRNNYEDWELLVNLGQHGWHGKLLPEYLFFYRSHGASMTTGAVQKHERQLKMVYDLHPDLFYDQKKMAALAAKWGDYSLKEKLFIFAKKLTHSSFFPDAMRWRLRQFVHDFNARRNKAG